MASDIWWINFILFGILCYPILSAFYVSFGLILYHHLFNDKINSFFNLGEKLQPFISIIIPAHNEHKTLKSTIEYLAKNINYYNYEILIIDDGSTDDTMKIANKLQKEIKKVRTVHVSKNMGKAHALNIGIAFARGDFILSNDADTIPERNALQKYMNYFMNRKNRNVGAVTANMDVRNRKLLITKSQIIEFTGIIGGTKRTQASISDSMYAFSGANTMYRKSALIDVGGFRQNRSTEDISIAWDLNFYQWQTKFAPNIFFYMLVPENFKELYRQRKRWSQGGTEVWMANFRRIIFNPILLHKQIPIYIESTLSNIWAFIYFISIIFIIITSVYYYINGMVNELYWLWLKNMLLICFEYIIGAIQLIIALHYDKNGAKMKYIIFAPIYISMLWVINPITLVITFRRALKTVFGKKSSGTWTSPKR